jgi:DNA polymerase-3 subunit delta'
VAFSDIIGHKEIIKALKASLADAKTGHAYLFLGPAGVGKKTLARAFAASLLCPIHAGECSDECSSCRLFRRAAHPDFIPIVPIGNSIKIEQLRELKHNAYLCPVLGIQKVFFFPEAEQLTEAAANSFLKILEEPPPGVVFIFTAVRADHILPTIRSRCQVYQLFPVPPGEIVTWLQDKGFAESEATRRGLDCHGLPGVALESTGESLDQPQIKFTDILGQDLLQLFKVANEIEKKERCQVLVLLQEWEAQLRINIIQVAQSSGGAFTKVSELLYCSEKIAQAIMMVENNVNLRLVVEEFFLALKVHAKSSFS